MDTDKLSFEVAKILAGKSIDVLFKAVLSTNDTVDKENADKKAKTFSEKDEGEIEQSILEALPRHLGMVASWSEKFISYRASEAMDTHRKTIALKIRTIPRRFADTENAKTISENSLMTDQSDVVLLGEPGAGKTTTLKRIAIKLLTEDRVGKGDKSAYPILVQLRDLNRTSTSLIRQIADCVGINYSIVENCCYIRKQKAIQVIPSILGKTKAVLLLDGLDELSTEIKKAVEDELVEILKHKGDMRVMVTCRSGDYTRNIGYLKSLEVSPLVEKDIVRITSKWLNKDKRELFFRELKTLPYKDYTNRPLFLTQILMIYIMQGYLPTQPSDIYQSITMLMLREWDECRGLHRISKYSGFDPSRKLDFLAHFAYELTYRKRQQKFTTKDLVNIYESIHESFSLPKNEAVHVALEIESHTGIVVESGFNKFEFTHMTLQESLCAHHIVRSPLAPHMANNYLKKYPAPLAIATAYSSDPSAWLSVVLLNPKNLAGTTLPNAIILFQRILVEKPIFTINTTLGECLIFYLFKSTDSLDSQPDESERLIDIIKELVRDDTAVKESIINALSGFYIVTVSEENNLVELANVSTTVEGMDFHIIRPASGNMRHSDLLELIDDSWLGIDELKEDRSVMGL